MRIKLTLEYDGTDFNGWQIQAGKKRTVQGELEKALLKIFKQKTRVIGSGRTDSGVHALGQVAHFETSSRMTPRQILKALNASLPQDVAVVAAQKVPPSFHAQYSAKSKIYRYTILNQSTRSPLLRHYSYFYFHPLNLTLMARESRPLLGRKDFRSFQAADPAAISESPEKTTIRTIKKIEIKKRGPLISIEIEADGFLYKMVRNLIGTLLEIGSGRLRPGSIPKILEKKDRRAAGKTAPATGLCLIKVRY